MQGDFDEARDLAEESLAAARRARDLALESRALGTLANVSMTCGEYQRAADLHAQAETIFRRLGDDRMLATAACNRAYLTLEVGDYERALGLAREAVDLSRAVGDPSNALSSLLNVALAAMALGEDSEARTATLKAVVQALELGHKEYLAVAVIATGALLAPTRPATTADLLRAATRARDELRLTLGPVEQDVLASAEAKLRSAVADHWRPAEADTAPCLSLEEAGELSAAELSALAD
jgi:tetratricopeptide (TPR) repeat protein